MYVPCNIPEDSTSNHRKVNDQVLKKVIEWCTHHRNDPPSAADEDADSRKKSTDIEEWDQKFMQVDQEMLFEIILVRNTSQSYVGFTNESYRPPITWISRPSLTSDAKQLQT